MAELTKQWNDGGSLTATYEGSGDGTAIFSSNYYEGIDREMPVYFKGAGLSIERTVKQEGRRQPIGLKDGGIFRINGGGRFGVLKGNNTYTELEYLESTGTQYINTRFVPNQDTIIIGKIECIVSNSTNWAFGSRYSSANRAYGFAGSSGRYYSSVYGADTGYIDNSFNKTTPFLLYKNKNKTYIDDIEAVVSNYTTFTSPVEMLLFACATRGTITNGKVKIYSLKIYDNEQISRDFIPVLDKEGVACMYDKVSGEFFYNQGTGDFIVGYK